MEWSAAREQVVLVGSMTGHVLTSYLVEADAWVRGITVLDDVDGGGLDDLLLEVGPESPIGCVSLDLTRTIRLVSSESSTVLWEQRERPPLRQVTATGDVDGDGMPDVVALDSAGIGAYSGATGARLWHRPLGGRVVESARIQTTLDHGIGARDIVLTFPDATADSSLRHYERGSVGQAYVLCGAGGGTQQRIVGRSTSVNDRGSSFFDDRLGHAAVALPDMDGDGVPDFAVSGGNYTTLILGYQSFVAVHPGRHGVELYRLLNPAWNHTFGTGLRLVGSGDERQLVAFAECSEPADPTLIVYQLGR